jgi:hypothetical protein
MWKLKAEDPLKDNAKKEKKKKKVMDTIYEHHHFVHFPILLVLPFPKFTCSRQQFILNYLGRRSKFHTCLKRGVKLWVYIAVFRVLDASHSKAVS